MKNIVILTNTFFLFSCSGESENGLTSIDSTPRNTVIAPPVIDTIKWLIGDWENKNEYGVMCESWRQNEDSALTGIVTGVTYIFSPSHSEPEMRIDTLETIRLEQQWGKLFYIPAVRDQNNGLPVKFKLMRCNETEFVFENKDHDFPQIIRYERFGTDSLVANVSGKFEGKEVVEVFPMKRVK